MLTRGAAQRPRGFLGQNPGRGAIVGLLHGEIELRPGGPRLPFVQIVHVGKDISRRGRDGGRPHDAEVRRLQGNDNDQHEDKGRENT